LVVIDASDDAAFDEWFQVFDASEALYADQSGRWFPEEWRVRTLVDDPVSRITLLGWRNDDDVLVAVAHVEGTSEPRAGLHTHPAWRRRGHGAQLLSALHEYLHQRGCAFFVIDQRIADHEDRAVASRFALAHGFELASELRRWHYDWPDDETHRRQHVDAVRAASAAYDVQSWTGPLDESAVLPMAQLKSQMHRETTLRSMVTSNDEWSRDAVRLHEQMVADMGRDLITTVAIERSTGNFVAFSELTVSHQDPSTAHQWETYVVEAHRGHRLGLAVKLQNLEEFARIPRRTERIATQNDATNAPMLAINAELGMSGAGGLWEWRTAVR
jgi:GNAT superfamily N-acetyltransferase